MAFFQHLLEQGDKARTRWEQIKMETQQAQQEKKLKK